MMPRRILDPEVKLIASISATLRAEYDETDLDWEGSPFAWIKARPSRQVGKIGEGLVSGWCAAKNFDVSKAADSECDRIIEGLRTEIKFSTLWKAGAYKFQQFRDQDYAIAICLGASPFDAHCWVIPKEILKQHVIGHTPQHGGRAGTDTAWLHVDPGNVPKWLEKWGGRLVKASDVLRAIVERAF